MAAMTDGATVRSAETSVPMRTTRIVVTAAMVVASVAAAIGVINRRMMVVVMSKAVVTVDGEQPGTTVPCQRTEEVVGSCEERVLPVIKDMTEVGIAIGKIIAIKVGLGAYAQEVIQIDLVAIVVLLLVEVQLISHLVGEETRLLAGFFIVHSAEGNGSAEAEHEGKNHLFHIALMFRGLTFSFV